MMKQVFLLLLFLAYGLTLSLSESKSGPPLPQPADQSFTLGYIQMKSAPNCSYKVVIETSCSSPKFTNDHVGIVFGDAYGHQVYAPKLGDPGVSRTFEQCSSDTFKIDGACASKICYVYLYRSGANENNVTWKPESLKIYGIDSKPINFDFNTSIPYQTWFGYNLCHFPIAPPPPHFDPFPPTPSPPPPFHPFPPSTPPPPPPTTTPPPPPTTTPPPPPPPHSASYKLVTPIWLIYVVLGFGLSFYV